MYRNVASPLPPRRSLSVDLTVSALSQPYSLMASSDYVEVSPLSQKTSHGNKTPTLSCYLNGSGRGENDEAGAARLHPPNCNDVRSQREKDVPLIVLLPTSAMESPRTLPKISAGNAAAGLREATASPLFASPVSLPYDRREASPRTSLSLSTSSNFLNSVCHQNGEGRKGNESDSGCFHRVWRTFRRMLGPPTSPERVWRMEAYEPPPFLSTGCLFYATILLGFVARSLMVVVSISTPPSTQRSSRDRATDRPLWVVLPSLFPVGQDGKLDRPWHSFASVFPLLAVLAVALASATLPLRYFTALHRPCASPGQAVVRGSRRRSISIEAERIPLLPLLYAMAGVGLLAVAHGPHFFLPLLIMSANYALFTRLQRWCPYRVFMAIMWVTHVALLYIIEVREGFEMTYWLQYYLPTGDATSRVVPENERYPLWSREMPWYVAYRMTMLRMIAFNYDLWEATHGTTRARERAMEKHDSTCVECAQLREQNAAHVPPLPAEASCCYKFRTEYARDAADYNFVHYAAYLLFPPLYLAGPMLSFNAFVSYMRVPSTSMPPRKMALYALRLPLQLLLLYFLCHYGTVVTLPTWPAAVLTASAEVQVSATYWYMAFLWLKLIFIWRSSRLFALLSGIETPEDMRRCFANTLTVRDFWRDWHASFNLWIVRYMYIPMGGRSRVALSVLPIFLFIAMWHDPALHLIKWALCIAFVFLAEFFVSAWFAWVSGVFRRERASASSSSKSCSLRGMGFLGCWQQSRATHCLTALAEHLHRHVSERTQTILHVHVRTVGCVGAVGALFIANMIGSGADAAGEVVVGAALWRACIAARMGFYVWLLVVVYSWASMRVWSRECEAAHERNLRRLYCTGSRRQSSE